MAYRPVGIPSGWHTIRLAYHPAVRREGSRLYTRKKIMADDKFQGRYRIDSARLADYDYGSNGMYFITICTQNRESYFGEIIADEENSCTLLPTPVGQRAIQGWQTIPQFSSFVQLDAFQLMPNHIHGVLWISKPNYTEWEPNRFGPQSQNLASIMRGFKSGVTMYALNNQLEFGWQARYYDRVIRNDDELHRIRQYIANNPTNWHQDQNNVENLFM